MKSKNMIDNGLVVKAEIVKSGIDDQALRVELSWPEKKEKKQKKRKGGNWLARALYENPEVAEAGY